MIFGDFLEAMFRGFIIETGKLSAARVAPNDATDHPVGLRVRGDPDLPFVAVDLAYQWVQPDISAIDARAEVGYGPVGLQARETHYEERRPRDQLDVLHIHGLFRVSASRVFQFNFGMGGIIVSGRRTHSGFSMTTPIGFYPAKNWGLRLTPTWSWIAGNPINDYDGSVEYVQRFYSLRAGYRSNRVDRESLHGPYLGVSFHY